MFVIAIGLVLSILNIINSIYSFLKSKRLVNKYYIVSKITNQKLKLFPRNSANIASNFFIWHLFIVYILFFVFDKSNIELSDIGIKSDYNHLVSFGIGVFSYSISILIWRSLINLSKYKTIISDNNFLVIRNLIPRQRRNKILIIAAIILLNPFTEEIIYRGILIYYFGNFFNNIYLAIVIGLLLSIAAHIYQSKLNIPFHLSFSLLSILLLYSPFGLVACFGFHFMGDLYPILMSPKTMRKWRDNNRIIINDDVKSYNSSNLNS